MAPPWVRVYHFLMVSLPRPPGGFPGTASTPARGAEPSRWTARLALLVSFLACILAVIGWFRPVSEPVAPEPPQYTQEEVAAAREKVCGAFEEAWAAISVTSRAEADGELALQIADAANARLAMVAAGAYMDHSLEAGASSDLASAVAEFSEALLKMSILTLGGVSKYDDEYLEIKADATDKRDTLKSRCEAK